MLPSLHPVLPARARTIRRIAVPVVVTSSLVVGALAAVTLAAAPASAAATTGTFTIGAAPVQLNQPSDPGMGTITPAADAATNGMFAAQVDWPIVPLQAALTRTGQLVSWGTPLNTAQQGGFTYDVWNPEAGYGTGSHVDYASGHGYDSFCNAFSTLADGRLLMVGGNSTMSSMIFDPATGDQTMGQNINHQRWYGTSLRLTDGRILVMGGSDLYNSNAYQNPTATSGVATTPEIGTGTGAWTDLTGARSDVAFGVADNRWWYPRAFNGPNGLVVGTSADQVWTLSAAGAGSVTKVGTLPFNPGVSGSQVMYAPGKELVAGGGQITNDDYNAATGSAATVDWNTATPTITRTASMATPRNWLNLTVLPTGDVMANGGTKVGNVGLDWTNSARVTEIWSPTTGQWRAAATAQRTRSYHSTSVLMPSGAVFTGGGGIPGPETNFNAELYYPSYLFTTAANGAVQWASRPEISEISGSATYGGTMTLAIGDGRAITGASLISIPSVTHSQNTDQRRIPLAVSQAGGTVSATLPTSLNTMPPGDYELTVTDAKGVPSAAQIITIRQGAAGLVTVAVGKASTAPAAGGAAPGTGTGTTPGTGTGTPGAGTGTGAGTTPGTGTGTGTGAGAGTTPGTGTGTVPTPSTAVKLPTGKAISIAPGSRTTTRVSHVGTTVTIRKASTKSSKAVRAASSWIVRTGLGSKKGYSFESVDKPGWYLAAPASGTGTMKLLKKRSSASFTQRTTFSSVIGAMRHDTSFQLTASPTKVVRVSGSKLVIGTLTASDAAKRAATFITAKGLASKR